MVVSCISVDLASYLTMENEMSELENLKAENAKLEDRIAKLEKAAEPPKPFVREPMPTIDYTAGMSMPREAIQAMIDAIPSSVMAGIVADALKPNPMTVSGGVTKPTTTEPPKVIGNKGWIDERPLSPPPGIAIMDRMMDAQDKVDRAELALRLAKAELGKGKD
jgi:hypothetical protein